MRVLITGGAGYLGSTLCPMLLAEGHEVTVLDDFRYGDTSLSGCVGNALFQVHRVDCRDHAAVRPFLKSADAVIPLAALVGAPICNSNPIDAKLLNRDGPLAIIRDLSPDQSIIFPSTESVYGKNATLCLEDTPCNPLSSYARMKRDVEEAALEHGDAIVFRFATVFGLSRRPRLDLLVNDFTWRALNDRAMVVFEGHAQRTYVHVSDVARAFLHALDVLEPGIYNVGSVTTTKLDLCAAIKKQLPEFFYVEAAYGTDPDARDYVVSEAKIEATGYHPAVSLDQGIAELLKGYRMLALTQHRNI